MKQLTTRYTTAIFTLALQASISAVFLAFFAYLLVEWAVGCGEHYVDSKGKVHTNECVFTLTKKGTN